MFTLLQPKTSFPLEDLFGTELANFTTKPTDLKPQLLTLVKPFSGSLKRTPFYLCQEDDVIADHVFTRPRSDSGSVDLYSTIFNAQTLNHTPVLVFPERLAFLKKKHARAKKISYRNCSFLVDILSLTDLYGTAVRDTAVYMLENNLIHFFGLEYESLQRMGDVRHLRVTKRVADLLK